MTAPVHPVLFDPYMPKKRGRPTKEMVAARAAIEAAKANVPKKTDEEILFDMKGQFEELTFMTEQIARGKARAMILSGAAGIGKTYNVTEKLDQMKHRYVSVSGGLSAVELYKLAYKYKHKGEVILIDDSDAVFREEQSINILKAMTDTTRKRVVSWRKASRELADDNIEKHFVYEGGVIYSTNLNFQAYVDAGRGNACHMAALISRSFYLDLHIHDINSLSLWINHVTHEGKMFEKEEISMEVGDEILKFLHENKMVLREYSLRTVKKMCDLTKMDGINWKRRAKRYLCR